VSVRLRPLLASDWPAVHSWARLPESSRHQKWGPNTEEQTREYCAQTAEAWRRKPQTRFSYAILDGGPAIGSAGDDRVVGTADLHLRGEGQGEIGYGVHPGVWGRGVATAAARLLLRIAFDEQGLHRVYATCDPRNRASARVLTKIAMTYEGRMRETVLLTDGWRDSSLYAILEDEWRASVSAAERPAPG
jgi:RimJ/RimL family protein N-acetyltransferase